MMLRKILIIFLLVTPLLSRAEFNQPCAPHNRLVVLSVLYHGFDNLDHQGDIVVLDTLATSTAEIFQDLYDHHFQLYQVGNHQNLHTATNTIDVTGAYSCRSITAGNIPSVHAYGAAVDINPRENPYIHFTRNRQSSGALRPDYTIPASGWAYITRDRFREGKPEHKGIVTTNVNQIFKKHGFLRWGGDWNTPIDYMHFEVYRDTAILLLTLAPADATQYFQLYQAFYNACQQRYPKAYTEMKFQDLSRAIAQSTSMTPVDIFERYGTERLLSEGKQLLQTLPKSACTTPARNLAARKLSRNTAIMRLDEQRIEAE